MSDILKNKTVYILTLGCKVNKYESDAMLEELKAAGCIALNGTENEGQTADISIVKHLLGYKYRRQEIPPDASQG